MKYNFDEPVNRKSTDSTKYDGMKLYMGIDDAIPMWVADMDFKAAPCIVNAMKNRIEHEVFGYSIKPDRFYSAIANWMLKRHEWVIKKEWIGFSPGVVAGFTIAIERFSLPGDKIIVQPPVYFPFFQSIADTGRQVIYNPLVIKNGRYYMDFNDLKKKITPDVKMLIISNPHNPGGTVWTKEELNELAEICNRYHILVISDEIHSDLVYAPSKHIPYASLNNETAMNSITVSSHSKAFNVPGLTTSFVIIPNSDILRQYNRGINIPHLHMGNIFGTEALIAAYSQGEDWLMGLMQYLKGNLDFMTDFVGKHIPTIKIMRPESTFLVWCDCKELGMTGPELKDFFLKTARVAVNEGSMFGPGGEGFVRINIGCTRKQLELALEQIKQASLTVNRKGKN